MGVGDVEKAEEERLGSFFCVIDFYFYFYLFFKIVLLDCCNKYTDLCFLLR